jgi:hypothetical protein
MTNPAKQTLRQLESLVAYPREDLGTELKGWLDLTLKEHKADLAQAILALANSGGGFILIGFAESDGQAHADADRPRSLNAYNQDSINGIVQHFAEPSFHCDVYHVAQPVTGLTFPVVMVPGEHRAPVRSKPQGPECKHVQMNTYYIRRPGPKSEPIQTGQEWDALIRRCMRVARDDLLSDIRGLLYGARQPTSEEGASTGRMTEWTQRALARFDELRKELTDAGKDDPYRLGYWWLAYSLEGEYDEPTPAALRDLLQRVERKTGWPVWPFLTRTPLTPHPYKDVVECWMAEGHALEDTPRFLVGIDQRHVFPAARLRG